jgi:hypothetical protein
MDEYLVKILKIKQQVLAHPLFKDMEKLTPLTKVLGGSSDAINDEAFAQSMLTKGAVYKGLGNFFDMDMVFTPTAGIPIQEERVLQVTEHHFKEPSVAFPFTFTIASPDALWQPGHHRGAWMRVSPEEFAHAALFGLKRDLDANVNESVLKTWAKMLRNVSYEFVELRTPNDMYFFSAQFREKMVTESAAARWNGLQRSRARVCVVSAGGPK